MNVVRLTFCLLLAPVLFAGADSAPAPHADATSPAHASSSSEATPAGEPAPDADSAPAEAADEVLESQTDSSGVNLLGHADSAAGESRRNENVQFDLIDNNAFKESAIRLGTSATIVREFEAEDSYFGAELGTSPDTPIHLQPLTARSVHGEAHWSHLNSVLSARSFFQVGAVKPAHENGYGGSLTTGLWSGAALSLSGSQRRIRGSVNGNVLVPRADERTALATDPAVRAKVEYLLSLYPDELPNRTDIDERMLNTNSPQSINDDSGAVILDQGWADKNHFSASYAYLQQRVEAFQLVRIQNPDTTTRSHNATATYSRTFSPRTTFELSAGFQRIGSLLTQPGGGSDPTVNIGGTLTSLGTQSTIPIDRAENRFRYAALVRASRGAHELTYGGGLSRRQTNGFEADTHRGSISFGNAFGNDAITNFRLGLPVTYFISVGDVYRGYRDWTGELYAGDHWRAASNLDLSFGLRYEFMARPTEVNALDEVPYDCDCNNLAPTFGFAYRLPRGYGLVRGAFGVQYGSVLPVTYQQLRYNAPTNVKQIIQEPSIVDPLAGFDPNNLDGVRSVRYALDPELASPYSMQYNFSWELEPASGWNLSLGYVGSRSPKLLTQWYLNRAVLLDGVPATLATVNDRRPDPTISEERRILNGSRGYYDAARIELRVPDWHGLSVDGSYWFSKLLDLGTDYTNTAAGNDAWRSRSQTDHDIQADMKSYGRFDQPHAALIRVSYQTPNIGHGGGPLQAILGRWVLSTVSLLKSGTPFNVEVGSDAPGYGNVDGTFGDRPTLLDTSILGRTIGNPDTSRQLLPREAFAYLQPGEAGTLARYAFRKGAIRNMNFAVSRRWSVGADASLTFRTESVNFLNTPQFAEPSGKLTDSNFNAITNTLNEGRTFRFTLEAQF